MLLRGAIFSLKFTKYRLEAGLRPDPLGELQRSPRPPSRNKGPTSKGREREGRESEEREREGRGREGRGGGREGRREGEGREKGRGNLLQGVRGIDAPEYFPLYLQYVAALLYEK